MNIEKSHVQAQIHPSVLKVVRNCLQRAQIGGGKLVSENLWATMQYVAQTTSDIVFVAIFLQKLCTTSQYTSLVTCSFFCIRTFRACIPFVILTLRFFEAEYICASHVINMMYIGKITCLCILFTKILTHCSHLCLYLPHSILHRYVHVAPRWSFHPNSSSTSK